MKFNAKALCVMTILGMAPGHVPAATSELVCRGDTYSVASGKKTAIKRFSRREITLTAEAGRTAIAFDNEKPMEADITESHYRATRSRQSGDWVFIMLNRETLEVTVSEFNTLPDHKHQSERFVGRCEINDPVALNL